MRIKHPTIPGMTADVHNGDEWLAAGWLPDEPKPAQAEPVEAEPLESEAEPKPRKGTFKA